VNVKGCANLRTINCANTKINNLDLSTCSSLKEVNITDCSELVAERIDSKLVFNIKRTKLVKAPIVTSAKDDDIRNILIVGWTGRGKSTLANVLISKLDEFEQVFKENELSVSQTKSIQSKVFEIEFATEQAEKEKVLYQVIDTPGIDDTKFDTNEVLDVIAEAVYLVRDGVSRVLFVTDGRFDKHETAAYNLLSEAIFDEEITQHTTIVRTKFESFQDEEECQQDVEKMRANEELKEIIESCDGRVIHVNNPSLEIKGASKGEIELNKSKRSQSRKKLLDHLKEVCQTEYNPPNLKDLQVKVYARIEKKKQLESSLFKLQRQLRRVARRIKNSDLFQTIQELKEEIQKENEVIRRAIFEHVQSRVSVDSLWIVNLPLPQKGGQQKGGQWWQKIKQFWIELINRVKLTKKIQKSEEINELLEVLAELEEGQELSRQISEIIANLKKEDKWIEQPALITKIAQQIGSVIDEYYQNYRKDLSLSQLAGEVVKALREKKAAKAVEWAEVVAYRAAKAADRADWAAVVEVRCRINVKVVLTIQENAKKSKWKLK